MMGIAKGLQTIKEYCEDDSNGYILRSGNHSSYSGGTDCAGLARMYAATVEGKNLSTFVDFGTWDEVDALWNEGWETLTFDYSKAERGDIFIRALGDSTGHTVVYLGDGLIAGAENDADGKSGDSSGKEIWYGKAYYSYKYNYMMRPASKWEPRTKVTPTESPLLFDGYFGPLTTQYLQKALRNAGYYPQSKYVIDGDFGTYTKQELQRYLWDLGYYMRSIDGDFGTYSVKALQMYLLDLGVYWDSYGWCNVDGDWGGLTTIAIQRALDAGVF